MPALFALALLGTNKWLNVRRVVYFGLIILAISTVFLVPLLWSGIKYGIENNQAIHFVYQDFLLLFLGNKYQSNQSCIFWDWLV